MLPRESTLMAADRLLGKKCFSEEVYTNIRDEHSETERVRKLFDALKPGSLRAYSIFYNYLKEYQKYIFVELEKRAWSDAESEPLPKRPKINEERAKERDKPQVQESRDETDSGSNPNFPGFTFSQLLQHVEEPEEMESLVASLEQRVREGQMEEMKSFLRSRALKNTVIFNHAEFKKMAVNQVLTEFLKAKNQAIFPVKLLENFFSGSAKKKSDGNTGMLQEEPFLSQDENFNVTRPGAQSTPCCPRQIFHSGTGATMPESVIESFDDGYETSTQKSSTLSEYWSDRGVDICISGTAGSDKDSGAFSAGALADTSSIVTFSNESPAVELAESASAKMSAEEILPGKPANESSFVKPPDVASEFESADEFPAVKPTDVSSAFTSANSFSAGTPVSTSPVVTPAFANLSVRPSSAIAVLSERPVEATSAVIESFDDGYETSTQKSSTFSEYWSDRGVDIGISGTAGSDKDSGAFSAGALADTSSIVTFSNESPAVELAESASAKMSAEEILPGKPANESSFVKPPDVASEFESADEFPAVKPTDVSSAFTSANSFSAGTPVGTSPVINPAFANLSVRPSSAIAILSERPVEATSAVLSAEEQLAVTQADASSAIKSADDGSAFRSLDEFSSDGPRGASLEVKPAIVNSSVRPAGEFAVDVNAGRSNHCNPKKRGSRYKIEKTKWQEKQYDILGNYLRKNISTQEVGKQGKMEDRFRIINNREHPRYPILQADHCNVIFDHKTNAKKIIEVLGASAFTKKGEPKEEYKFRAQFHMWLLGVSETVILSENKEHSLEKRPFDVEEKRFQQFIIEVVIPALALYKNLQYSMIVA